MKIALNESKFYSSQEDSDSLWEVIATTSENDDLKNLRKLCNVQGGKRFKVGNICR